MKFVIERRVIMKNQNELTTFSHELKNSLTLIYSQLQYIEQTHPELLADLHWSGIKDDFSSVFDMVRHMLAPASDASAALEPVDLTSLLEEIKYSWSSKLKEHGIKFSVQAEDSSPYYIKGSKTKFLQIFNNLISNGVNAISRKKETAREPLISVHVSREGSFIVCSLSDTGIGMTKEQQARAFYRGVSFEPKGNGIGLSVVSEIAKDLDISIHMDSALNQGTTFTLIFPGLADTAK